MMQSSRKLFFSFALVFSGGVVVGALGYRYYDVQVVAAPGRSGPPPNPEEVRKRIIKELSERLKLTPEQSKQLDGIFDETHKRFMEMRERHRPEEEVQRKEREAIRQDLTEKIRAMLTPEQRVEFEKYRQEREDKRKQLEKKLGPKSGPQGTR